MDIKRNRQTMKWSLKQKKIFVLVLSIGAFIYSIADIVYQMQSDVSPRLTSWFVFIYSLTIIIIMLKDWKERE